MAPKTAVPNEPPIMRKKVALDVATPEILVGDGVLHGHHQHLHDQAEADAEDEHVGRHRPTHPCASPMSDMRYAPIVMQAVPTIGKIL